jgi:hypothetical protein
LTAEPEPAPKKYRTPTILDLSNGPIECEVSDDNDIWQRRLLTFVSDRKAFAFYTVDPNNKDQSGLWKRCRIEVAFDPVTDLSQTAARMVGKAIDQMIHRGQLVKPPQPEPVIKDCLTTGSNCPEIPDSSSGATGNPPKALNAARDLNSQFWEEAYQIMISLFNSGLSVEQIKQELLSRLPEGGSSK